MTSVKVSYKTFLIDSDMNKVKLVCTTYMNMYKQRYLHYFEVQRNEIIVIPFIGNN